MYRHRLRIQKELAGQHRQQLFQKRRKMLLKNTVLEEKYETTLLCRSMDCNGLLAEVRENNLLSTLWKALLAPKKTTEGQQGHDITYKFVASVASNILLDDLTIDEREEAMRICKQALHCLTSNGAPFSVLSVVAHTIDCMCGSLKLVDQDLEMECEQQISVSLRILMGYIFLREEVGLYWEDYSQITQDVLMAVMAWLNPVPQYVGQIASKVNRNVDLFSLLIEGHFDFIALHLQTDKEYQSKREQLLNGFLSIYRLIAANFSSTLSFSPIFDNIMIYSVAIAAISRTLCESIERDAYLLIIALLDERCQSAPQDVFLFLDQAMGNVGRQLLLKNLLEIGKNTDVKLRVLKTLAWKEVSGNGLQQFIPRCYEEIIELSCQVISRFNRSDLTMEEPAETALYVLNMLALCQESHRYMACFTIKGGLVLLEQACETYNAQLREQSGEETILSLAEALELSVQLNSSA